MYACVSLLCLIVDIKALSSAMLHIMDGVLWSTCAFATPFRLSRLPGYSGDSKNKYVYKKVEQPRERSVYFLGGRSRVALSWGSSSSLPTESHSPSLGRTEATASSRAPCKMTGRQEQVWRLEQGWQEEQSGGGKIWIHGPPRVISLINSGCKYMSAEYRCGHFYNLIFN